MGLYEDYKKLPERAQELWLKYLHHSLDIGDGNAAFFAEIYGLDTDDCKSPIEQIFYLAFNIYRFERMGDEDACYLSFDTQVEIQAGERKYIADFVISHEWAKREKPGLIVECDGHEFHEKTKEQVRHDNERDLALKKLGYDILHFSGSQVFRNPMDCAKEAYEYYYQIREIDEYGKSGMDSSA